MSITTSYGYVYCMTNKYMPNLCKIGFINTENKTSENRAKELSKTTSCPFMFQVVYDIKVKNPQKYEKRIHKKLKHVRINPRREFFLCKPEDIIKYFNKNNLIKSFDENDDFSENYLTKYDIKQEIEQKKSFIYDSYREIFVDIYSIFYVIIRIFISMIYYVYMILKKLNFIY